MMIAAGSKITSEFRFLDADAPSSASGSSPSAARAWSTPSTTR